MLHSYKKKYKYVSINYTAVGVETVLVFFMFIILKKKLKKKTYKKHNLPANLLKI